MSHLVYITLFGETDGVTLSRLGCSGEQSPMVLGFTLGPYILLSENFGTLKLGRPRVSPKPSPNIISYEKNQILHS